MDKITEKQNPKSSNLDLLSNNEILNLMNDEDNTVSINIKKNIPLIAKLIDDIVENIHKGGRIFYVGCGTSGRLGVLDASECPPTFSVKQSLVQGIIAGGNAALVESIENAEDSFKDGKKQIVLNKINSTDTVIGISANGSAKFVHGALSSAKKLNALTSLITFNKINEFKYIDYLIVTIVGPEIISGSTRLKAGTATKMILNMISTTTMIKLNKVYKNFMIDLKISNIKLLDRAINIISNITGENQDKSKLLLNKSNKNIKSAIVMHSLNVSYDKSLEIIRNNNGNMSKIINHMK